MVTVRRELSVESVESAHSAYTRQGDFEFHHGTFGWVIGPGGAVSLW
jgi:hypothetical protein